MKLPRVSTVFAAPEHARLRRERLTDGYIITILCVFPLFPGFSGYQNITEAKYLFFLISTAAWLTAGLALTLLGGLKDRRRSAAPLCCGLFWLSCCASALCSPWRGGTLLGAGRYDGLLTLSAYAACFLGMAFWSRPKKSHVLAFGAGMTLCCTVGAAQLLNIDPLGLFPGGLTYYDRDVLYSGAYLTTLGNTNVLDAVLSAALPLFAACYVLEGWTSLLPPLFFCAAILGTVRGDGAAVALGLCCLVGAPLLLTDRKRVQRALRCAGTVLAGLCLAFAYRPEYTDRVLTPRLRAGPAALSALAAAAICCAASFLRLWETEQKPPPLRRIMLGLDAAVLLGGLLTVYLWPGESGTLYELKCLLHGELREEFGSSRLGIWRECLKMVPERPLLGGGPGTLPLRLDIRFSRYVPETGGTLRSYVDNAHSVFLGYLVNCGSLCLTAYLALLVSCGFSARRGGALAAALAFSVLGGAIHSCFGLGLCLSEPVFWTLLGMLAACGVSGRDNRRGEDSEDDQEEVHP